MRPLDRAVLVGHAAVVARGRPCRNGRTAPGSARSCPPPHPCAGCRTPPTGCRCGARAGTPPRCHSASCRPSASAVKLSPPSTTRAWAKPRPRQAEVVEQVFQGRAGDAHTQRSHVGESRTGPDGPARASGGRSRPAPGRARHASGGFRRSSVRRTPGSSSGWRRISSWNTPTGRMPGLLSRIGTTTVSKTSASGSGRRRPRRRGLPARPRRIGGQTVAGGTAEPRLRGPRLRGCGSFLSFMNSLFWAIGHVAAGHPCALPRIGKSTYRLPNPPPPPGGLGRLVWTGPELRSGYALPPFRAGATRLILIVAAVSHLIDALHCRARAGWHSIPIPSGGCARRCRIAPIAEAPLTADVALATRTVDVGHQDSGGSVHRRHCRGARPDVGDRGRAVVAVPRHRGAAQPLRRVASGPHGERKTLGVTLRSAMADRDWAALRGNRHGAGRRGGAGGNPDHAAHIRRRRCRLCRRKSALLGAAFPAEGERALSRIARPTGIGASFLSGCRAGVR